jgi:hypothetical protein
VKRLGWENNDEDIRRVFQDFPDIKHNMNPESIYKNIAGNVYKKRKKTWVLPAIVTLAASLIFAVLAAALYKPEFNSSSYKKENEQVVAPNQLEDSHIFSKNHKRYGVQPGQHFITYGVFDPKGSDIIIPISILTKNKEKSFITNFKTLFSTLPVQPWGLSTMEIYNINNLSEVSDKNKRKSLIVDIPKLSSLSTSSSGDAFAASINEGAYWNGYSKIQFKTDGKIGAKLFAKTITTLNLPINSQRAFYQYSFAKNYPTLLYRSNETFASLNKALEAMDNKPMKRAIKSPIPEGVKIKSVGTSGDHVNITFTNDSVIQKDNVIMMDAIMLTAGEFGFKTVTFNGAGLSKIKKVGDIKFDSKTPIPLAPNPINLEAVQDPFNN